MVSPITQGDHNDGSIRLLRQGDAVNTVNPTDTTETKQVQ